MLISLYIIGLYLLIKVLNRTVETKSQFLHYFGSGFFIGLSLITRTSEIIWIGMMLVILFFVNRAKISWHNIVIFISIIILVFLPIFYINNELHGSPLSFSYSSTREPIEATSLESASRTVLLKLQQLILPFGIHFDRTGLAFYQYII